MRKISSHPDSSIFHASSVPDCIMHITDSLSKDIRFKESKERSDIAGACGLAFLRTAEIISTSVEDLRNSLHGIDEAVLEKATKKLVQMQNDITDISTSGTKVVAGFFNQEVSTQRKLILTSKVGSSIKDTLSFCPLTSELLFEAKGTRIKDALEAARSDRSAGRTSSYQPRKSSYKKPYSKKPSAPKSSSDYKVSDPSAPKEKRSGNYRGRSQRGKWSGHKK